MCMEELARKMNALLEKQDRIIEELFRHSHQHDLLLTTQERTNALLEEIRSAMVPREPSSEKGKKVRLGAH